MDLKTQTQFAKIYSNLKSEQHTVQDISDIIKIINDNKHSISDDAKKILLQIPLCVLETQVDLKNQDTWASKNGHYFAGNHAQEPIHSRFASEDFDLDIMVDCLIQIMSDSYLLNCDFNLRNPQVTLRDNVIPKQYSNFKESGKLFARIMEKAFDC